MKKLKKSYYKEEWKKVGNKLKYLRYSPRLDEWIDTRFWTYEDEISVLKEILE